MTQDARRAKRAGRVVLEIYGKYDQKVRELARAHDVTCRVGCSHCCKLPASASVPEMVPVVAYLADRADWPKRRAALEPKIRAYLEVAFPVDPQDGAARAAFYKQQVPCVFLDDDQTCSIYPVRPSACRYHLAVSPPENCAVDAVDNQVGLVNLRKLEDLVILAGASEMKAIVGGSIPAAFATAAKMLGVELSVDETVVEKATLISVNVVSAEQLERDRMRSVKVRRGAFFQCQACDGICHYDSREPLTDQGEDEEVEIKTIANRFCNARACVEQEAEMHGVSVERVLEWHAPRSGD